jgi:hypothetical protein
VNLPIRLQIAEDDRRRVADVRARVYYDLRKSRPSAAARIAIIDALRTQYTVTTSADRSVARYLRRRSTYGAESNSTGHHSTDPSGNRRTIYIAIAPSHPAKKGSMNRSSHSLVGLGDELHVVVKLP